MAKAIDVALHLMKHGMDSTPNTYDGNMKLQKMLCFANLISLSENGETLFDDNVYAFENGLVVEDIRLRYKNDYNSMKADSIRFSPTFTDKEYSAINIACDIFGDATAKELSEMTHLFNFWKVGYERSKNGMYKDKSKSVVTVQEMSKELDRIADVVLAYKQNRSNDKVELVNGIKFFISPLIDITDELYSELYAFSLVADEPSYTVCYDNGSMVIC